MANNPRFSNTLQALADAQSSDPITLTKPRRESWFDRQAKVAQLQNSKQQVVTAGLAAVMEQVSNIPKVDMYQTLSERNLQEAQKIEDETGMKRWKFDQSQARLMAENDAAEQLAKMEGIITRSIIANGGAVSAGQNTALETLLKLKKSHHLNQLDYSKAEAQKIVNQAKDEGAKAESGTQRFSLKDADGNVIVDEFNNPILRNQYEWNSVNSAAFNLHRATGSREDYLKKVAENQILSNDVLLSDAMHKRLNDRVNAIVQKLQGEGVQAEQAGKNLRSRTNLLVKQVEQRSRGLELMKSAYQYNVDKDGKIVENTMHINMDMFEAGMDLFDMGGQWSINENALRGTYQDFGVKAIMGAKEILESDMSESEKMDRIEKFRQDYMRMTHITHQEGPKLLNLVTTIGSLIENPEALGQEGATWLYNYDNDEDRINALFKLFGYLQGGGINPRGEITSQGNLGGNFWRTINDWVEQGGQVTTQSFQNFDNQVKKFPDPDAQTTKDGYAQMSLEDRAEYFRKVQGGDPYEPSKRKSPKQIATEIFAVTLPWIGPDQDKSTSYVANAVQGGNYGLGNRDNRKAFQENASPMIIGVSKKLGEHYANLSKAEEDKTWNPANGLENTIRYRVLTESSNGIVVGTYNNIREESLESKARKAWVKKESEGVERGFTGEGAATLNGTSGIDAQKEWLDFLDAHTKGELGGIKTEAGEFILDNNQNLVKKRLGITLNGRDHAFMSVVENDIISNEAQLPGEFLNLHYHRNQQLHRSFLDGVVDRIGYIGKTLGYNLDEDRDRHRMQYLVHQIYLKRLNNVQISARQSKKEIPTINTFINKLYKASGGQRTIDPRGVVPKAKQFYNRSKGYNKSDAELIKAYLLSENANLLGLSSNKVVGKNPEGWSNDFGGITVHGDDGVNQQVRSYIDDEWGGNN